MFQDKCLKIVKPLEADKDLNKTKNLSANAKPFEAQPSIQGQGLKGTIKEASLSQAQVKMNQNIYSTHSTQPSYPPPQIVPASVYEFQFVPQPQAHPPPLPFLPPQAVPLNPLQQYYSVQHNTSYVGM